MICDVVYRHPRNKIGSFANDLYHCLDKSQQENIICVIMGDFNINYTSHASMENFVNTMYSYFHTPYTLKPTRITGSSTTFIDNIFFNSITYHTVSGNILTDISDHLLNFLIFDKLNALPKHFIMYQRDYLNLDETALIDEVSSVNWKTISFCS